MEDSAAHLQQSRCDTRACVCVKDALPHRFRNAFAFDSFNYARSFHHQLHQTVPGCSREMCALDWRWRVGQTVVPRTARPRDRESDQADGGGEGKGVL